MVLLFMASLDKLTVGTDFSALHIAVAISCCLSESGYVILDPTKLEEQVGKFTY